MWVAESSFQSFDVVPLSPKLMTVGTDGVDYWFLQGFIVDYGYSLHPLGR